MRRRSPSLARAAALLALSLAAGCAEDGPASPSDAATGDASTAGMDLPAAGDGAADAARLDALADATGLDRTSADVTTAMDATPAADVPAGPCVPVSCGGRPLQCGDCVDNDGDGRADARDPECLGPCDNTEGPVLLAGVGGEAGGPCQSDCYFDFGNGPGNDDCQWDHRCDPLAVAPDYPPEGMACAYDRARVGSRDCPVPQSRRCLDVCLPITPNGCDCFGCCTFPQLAGRGPGGAPAYVWLGSRAPDGSGSCTLERVTDPRACRACTPVRECLNPCEPCEVCVGRPAPDARCGAPSPDAGTPPGDVAPGADVPRADGATTDAATPADGGVSRQCPAGYQPCGLPGQGPCPALQYCITGCCIAAPQ